MRPHINTASTTSCTHYRASTPVYVNRPTNTTTWPVHTHLFQHPPSPLLVSTNVVGDIDVGLGCDERFDAFGVIEPCRGVHWSPAILWPHNTTHGRDSVCHVPLYDTRGDRHGHANKGQYGVGGRYTKGCMVHGAGIRNQGSGGWRIRDQVS